MTGSFSSGTGRGFPRAEKRAFGGTEGFHPADQSELTIISLGTFCCVPLIINLQMSKATNTTRVRDHGENDDRTVDAKREQQREYVRAWRRNNPEKSKDSNTRANAKRYARIRDLKLAYRAPSVVTDTRPDFGYAVGVHGFLPQTGGPLLPPSFFEEHA